MYRNNKNNMTSNGQQSRAMLSNSQTPASTPASSLKGFGVLESCDKIKDEFELLQSQYNNLRHELDKLGLERSEIQRHYIMYYEMSYGLNISLCKENEICKRLNSIILQLLPFLSREHQQQVAMALDRAKQISLNELSSIISCQFSPSTSNPGAHYSSHLLGSQAGFVGSSASMLTTQNLGSSSLFMPSGLSTSTSSSTIGGQTMMTTPSAVANVAVSSSSSSSSAPSGPNSQCPSSPLMRAPSAQILSSGLPPSLPPPIGLGPASQQMGSLGLSQAAKSHNDMANFLAMAGLMPGALQVLGSSPHPLASLANSLVGSQTSATPMGLPGPLGMGMSGISGLSGLSTNATLESALTSPQLGGDSRRPFILEPNRSVSTSALSRHPITANQAMPGAKIDVQMTAAQPPNVTSISPPAKPVQSSTIGGPEPSSASSSSFTGNMVGPRSPPPPPSSSAKRAPATTTDAPRSSGGNDTHRPSKGNKSQAPQADGSSNKRSKTSKQSFVSNQSQSSSSGTTEAAGATSKSNNSINSTSEKSKESTAGKQQQPLLSSSPTETNAVNDNSNLRNFDDAHPIVRPNSSADLTNLMNDATVSNAISSSAMKSDDLRKILVSPTANDVKSATVSSQPNGRYIST